jgi:uncharacterized protein YdiU (UPF0061 family)
MAAMHLDNEPEQAAEEAKAALKEYQPLFENYYADIMRSKLGLLDDSADHNNLWKSLLDIMHKNNVDYTLMFRSLSYTDTRHKSRDLFLDREACDAWMRDYQKQLDVEGRQAAEHDQQMKSSNPKFILRNYLAEIAIRKAEDENDFSEIETLMQLLQNPFDEHMSLEHYAGHPPDWASRIEVSCSS